MSPHPLGLKARLRLILVSPTDLAFPVLVSGRLSPGFGPVEPPKSGSKGPNMEGFSARLEEVMDGDLASPMGAKKARGKTKNWAFPPGLWLHPRGASAVRQRPLRIRSHTHVRSDPEARRPAVPKPVSRVAKRAMLPMCCFMGNRRREARPKA